MNALDDTIAAIATPVGEAGIAVIRVSGPRSVEFCDRRFHGKKPLMGAATHTAHYGDFTDRHGEKLDEVVATIFRAPHSYTTDDVVEISCHGGPYVSRAILAELIDLGARPAEPGEFTKRAFLNGRIDLSQAEAVADLIHARSKISHHASIEQLTGKISRQVEKLRHEMLDLASLLELELDFTEEGIALLTKEELIERLKSISTELERLLSSYGSGRIIREGVKVVLTGKPNVGKSSILNSLLNYDRAIVSAIPGTTRDTLEENVNIEGLLLSITDTAGLRNSFDEIEGMGIERARRELQNADITLFVIDVTNEFGKEDIDLIEQCKAEAIKGDARLIIIENKIDLLTAAESEVNWEKLKDIPRLRISAKSGQGIDSLRSQLIDFVSREERSFAEGSAVITSQRHEGCLRQAKEFIDKATGMATRGANSELVAENVNMSTKALGEIIGIVTSDDVLNNIFAHFCIGK